MGKKINLLDSSSGIPLYLQLKNWIEAQISSGQLSPGNKVPSENELVEQLGISRATVRQGYQKLVDCGFLIKIRGRGTFVSQNHGAPEEFFGNNNQTIAFLMRGAIGGVQPSLIKSISSAAFQYGYSVTINNTGNSLERALEYVNHIAKQKACGIIFRPLTLNPFQELNYRICEEIQKFNIPFVFIDIPVNDVPAVCIRSDNYEGGKQVGSYLKAMGHQNVLIVSNCINPTTEDRCAGFETGLNHPCKTLCYYEEIEGDFERKMLKSLHSTNRPTAIFAMHDLVARKIYSLCSLEKICIPGDVSVVGYDNLDFSELLMPPLTTVLQHLDRMGEQTVNELVKIIKKPVKSSKNILIPVEMVERESVIARKTGLSPDATSSRTKEVSCQT